MKIVLFNCRFSANLGDRLLVECLVAELLSVDPDLTVVAEDLGGRNAPPSPSSPRRLRLVAMFLQQFIPGPLRRQIAYSLLNRMANRRLRPRWQALLADADAVVIGGGGILADSDLNFPVKISTAIAMANARKLPVAVHAVGVGSEWSQTGKRLISQQLEAANLCRFTVRDSRAQASWNAQFSEYHFTAPELALDPALTASWHMANEVSTRVQERPIGLCLTSVSALRYHADHVAIQPSIDEWYVQLAAELVSRGHTVIGFTTGSPEDVTFAARLSHRLDIATKGAARVLPPFGNTANFVVAMQSSRAIVSHRLHALIAGYNWNVPGLALAWDSKMQGQMEAMGYPERLIDPATISPAKAADRLEVIISEGIDREKSAALTAKVRSGTIELVGALRQAVHGDG